MKKFGILFTTLLLTFSIFSSESEAKKKSKSKGMVSSFGNAVESGVKSGVSKNVKGGFYGKSTMDVEEKAVAKPKPTPTPEVASLTSGVPLDPETIKKNKSKDDHIAAGILLLNSEEYEKALSEFNKAKVFSNDKIVQRWIEVANNKMKVKEVNTIIDNLNGTKSK